MNFTLSTNLIRQLTSIRQIIQAVQTCLAVIGDLYFADSPYSHVIHSGTIKADSSDFGSVSYLFGVVCIFWNINFLFLIHCQDVFVSVTYQMFFSNSKLSVRLLSRKKSYVMERKQ